MTLIPQPGIDCKFSMVKDQKDCTTCREYVKGMLCPWQDMTESEISKDCFYRFQEECRQIWNAKFPKSPYEKLCYADQKSLDEVFEKIADAAINIYGQV